MINIRRNCFETNSSSTHAIIISSESVDPIFNVDLSIGEFGWEHRVINDIDEKASYLYTAACELYCEDVFNKIKDMLLPYEIGCFSSIKPEWGTFEDGSKYLYNGYIDHVDETKDFVEYVLSSPEHLISFTFNDKSYIVSGNDNCDEMDYEWFTKKVQKADSYEHKTFYKGN